MTDRPILASDKERESVVDVLRDAYTDGRLTLDEFEERTASAYAARTWADLRELTGDLPVEPVLGDGLLLRSPHPEHAVPGIVPPAGSPRPSRRERPPGMLLPVVFIWIMISAAAGSPDTAAALSVVFICLLACRIRLRRTLITVSDGDTRENRSLIGNTYVALGRAATISQPASRKARRHA